MAKHNTLLDTTLMQRALALARRGQGRVEPNPMVGCVLARADRALAEGYHRHFGGPHAEIEALHRAGTTAKGSTAYLTLEPCSHFGKTPPCADALIRAGVKRVVVAMKDPFPDVAGRGIQKLRRAGIRVDVGLCRDQAAELNAPYLTLLQKKRPYVILKWAQSIDGKIATRTGDSQWISSPQSRRLVHRLRARVDGVMIGINTVLSDNPRLTARDVPLRRTATRIVLDTHLQMDPQCRLASTADQVPVLVITSPEALRTRNRRAKQLEERGLSLQPCRLRNGRINLASALGHLGNRQMTNLLVEGGGRVLADFLDHHLADEAYAFIAPKLIGGADATTAFGGRGAALVSRSTPIRGAHTSRVGPDTLIHLTFA